MCTGYKINLPFLKDVKELKWENNKVTPLYNHVFYANDPTLCFIGIPFRIVPFVLF